VEQKGHRSTTIRDVVLRADEETDLGTIPLEPTPVFRARVVDADGQPWAGNISIYGPSPTGSLRTFANEEGRVTVFGDVPEHVVLRMNENWSRLRGIPDGAQLVVVDGWHADEEKTIQIRRWQTVDVRVGGPAVDPPGMFLNLQACPAS